MAKTAQQGKAPDRTTRRNPDAVREALVAAGARLLTERPPSAITGRELADAARVNYGFVHHYFGGKDAVLRASLFRLRDEFLDRHPKPEDLPLLAAGDPFVAALVRSQMDYPDPLGPIDMNTVGGRVVEGVRVRTAADGVEAYARGVALMALQLAYGAFRELLLDAAGVEGGDRRLVDERLGALYDELAGRPVVPDHGHAPSSSPEPPSPVGPVENRGSAGQVPSVGWFGNG